MVKKFKTVRYKTFREIIDDNDNSCVIDFEDGFYRYPISSIQYFPDSSKITILLSSLERNLLEFMIKTMNNNFLIKPDLKWKSKFNEYLKVMGAPNLPTDASIRRGVSNIKKKRGLINLYDEKRVYMVNPLYFSRSDLNRDSAISFLLNIGCFTKVRCRTIKKTGLLFDAGQQSLKQKNFTLSTFEFRGRRNKLNEHLFEKDSIMIPEEFFGSD